MLSEADAIMWDDSIVVFGDYDYKYASGREGDLFLPLLLETSIKELKFSK